MSSHRTLKIKMQWNGWWMTWIPITMARWTSPSSSSSWGRWPWPATTSSWTARRPKSPMARTTRLQQRKRKSNEQMLQKQREKTERSINRLHGWEQESAQVSSISLTGTDKPRSWRRFLCFYNSTQAVNILLKQNWQTPKAMIWGFDRNTHQCNYFLSS